MKFDIWYLSSYSILPATILGMIRYKDSSKSYHPFFWLLFVGLIAEFFNIALIRLIKNNLIVHRYLIIVEFSIILYQLRAWGLFKRDKWHYWTLQSLVLVAWLAESIIGNNLFDPHHEGINSYSKTLSSFFIVILSLQQMNKVIVTEKIRLVTNPKFLICCGLVLSFTYLMLQSIFLLYGSVSYEFMDKILLPFAYCNLFVNLVLFLGAVVYIPKNISTNSILN